MALAIKKSQNKTGKRSSIGLILFASVFAAVGLGFLLLSVIPTVYDYFRMQGWQPVQAQLLNAKLTSHSSDGSTTYGVKARYEYEYNGLIYQSSRVAISSSNDNIGDFQYQLGRKLERAYQQQHPITAYVNPDSPEDAILNRDLRPGLLAFKMIFVLVFGGFGVGLMYFGFKKHHAGKNNTATANEDEQPWLQQEEWKDNHIYSGANLGMKFFWGFAIFWNLISAPIAFQIPSALNKGEYGVLAILIFNFIGLFLIILAIRKTLEWKKFGKIPLVLDPFPGSIGGHVGGTLDTAIPYRMGQQYMVTLSQVHSYMSGSGKNRKRSEKTQWQDSLVANTAPSLKGTKLTFQFTLPEGLNSSEARSENYHLWRLHIKTELDGIDLDRTYEIPVYATAEESRHLTYTENHETVTLHQSEAEKAINLERNAGGMQFYFPYGRQPGLAIMLVIFGSIFLGVGIGAGYLGYSESFYFAYLFTLPFGLIGLFIFLFGLYTPINSLRVQIDNLNISTQRGLLGFTVSEHNFKTSDISKLSYKRTSSTQGAGPAKLYYDLYAHLNSGKKIKLAENILGERAVKHVQALVESNFPGMQW